LIYSIILGDLEGCYAGFGNRVILVTRASADANGADDFSVFLERDSASEDHDFAVVRRVDAEELVAGLGVGGEIFGGDIEGAGCPGLFDGDVDGAEPGVVHADVRDEVAAGVGYGDVHGLANFDGFLFGCGDDAAGVC
jgi:hypothetical protein